MAGPGARISGHRTSSRRAPERPGVSIGSVPERNVTCLVISESGLYLRTLWPFRIFRPALLIPWPAIKRLRAEKVLWQTRYVIETESPIPIVVSKKAYAAIHPYVSAHVSLS